MSDTRPRRFPSKPYVIKIKERKSPKAIVIKYIMERIGMNVRPMEPEPLSGDHDKWKVPLKAIVPNRVTMDEADPGIFRSFKFEKVGYVTVENVEDKWRILDYSKAADVEEAIKKKFWGLHSFVEEELIKAGKEKWGKLSVVQTFLRPLYSILNHILEEGHESFTQLNQEKPNYVDLLIRENMITHDYKNPDMLVPSNLLNTIYKQTEETHTTVTIAVGTVFTNRYPELLSDFQIRSIIVPVDLAARYYVDAIDYGKNVRIHENIIVGKFLSMRRRSYKHEFYSHITAKQILSELDSINILEKVERGYYRGEKVIFDAMMLHRDKLASEMIEYDLAPK